MPAERDPCSTRPPCPACASQISRTLETIAGYVRGPSFEVAECERCRTQTARPTTVPERLYDAIYAHADKIEGGYHRYLNYARAVAEQSDPFDWLSEQEDMYWGVREIFKTVGLEAGADIVEVGSGLGYLTHALRVAGFDAHGIDLSGVAVDAARKRYGEHYSVGDAAVSDRMASARMVIAMELIEHLADPAAFLARMRNAMHTASNLILSTPNRDTYPGSAVWNTDLPPVHFHWFSEAGITSLAERCGFSVRFADFSSRNSTARRTRWIAGQRYRAPRFDESLEPCAAVAPPAKAAPAWRRLVNAGRFRVAKAVRAVFHGDQDVLHGRRSVAMVALLSPTP